MELRFFEIYRSSEYLWILAEGAGTSVALTTLGGLLGFTVAVALALARTRQQPFLSYPAAVYVEVVRNTPLIVQLFFIAFGLPQLLNYQWPFWGHALLALTINFSGYFAEILRAGFEAVPKEQREAARALGLPRRLVFRKITFPQAVARMYPSLNSQFIFLFLTTGIISEIGIEDLTHAGLYIDSRTFRSFEVFLTLTALYILIALAFKAILRLVEARAFAWKDCK
ncbi:amino acid ABC transporter permease [Rhodovibrio salinarum]|uniref:Amino acid ABC transporter permease n=1 Tax=Rhodovibrio salinarum TaxID=1087 RepID=A0A934V076_9PROT|nr:amino acid ABC transporter permease [Rhodovibrio salinarum]MBK1697498.1 amino acid ABC transporter permease [Rhodovibrio salinarum]